MAGGVKVNPVKVNPVPTGLQPLVKAETLAVKDAEIRALKAELASLTSRHATELKLEAANVMIELQPALRQAHDKGYQACKQAMEDARKFLNGHER